MGAVPRSKRPLKLPRVPGKAPWRLLLTCVGRRVELVQAFRQAARSLQIAMEIHGADANPLSPALHFVDKTHTVAPIREGHYIEELLRIVRKHKIDLLIPLIDPELGVIASATEQFDQLGCQAVISSPEVVRVTRDKIATYRALRRAGIDTPRTRLWTDAVRCQRHRFPYFLKPRTGSAGMENHVIHDRRELETFGRRVDDAIVQEFVEGVEHTLDVYTGLDGRPRCIVPRKRLETRTGEVSKGLIVKDRAIMAVGKRVAEMLVRCRGVITIQCIVTPRRRIRVIEINPRFGGGVPLAIRAGADFPKWLLMETRGQRPRINPTGFRDDLAMIRYDQSVFVPRASRSVSRR